MKSRIMIILLGVLLLGCWQSAFATYGEITTSWDSLPTLQLPSLRNQLWEKMTLNILGTPVGAYARLDSTQDCANHCDIDWRLTEPGTIQLVISNRYGYGEEFDVCKSLVNIEFGSSQFGMESIHCRVSLRLEGSHILPKIRIGEVAFTIEPDPDFEVPGTVYLYPQIEILSSESTENLLLKPVWQASITVGNHKSFEVSGWNDCAGMRTCSNCRGPCKPSPIPLAWIEENGGLVKIAFDPRIIIDVAGNRDLQFESDTLEFWYDVLNEKRVER